MQKRLSHIAAHVKYRPTASNTSAFRNLGHAFIEIAPDDEDSAPTLLFWGLWRGFSVVADSVMFCMFVVSCFVSVAVSTAGRVVRCVVLDTGTRGFFGNFLDEAEVWF